MNHRLTRTARIGLMCLSAAGIIATAAGCSGSAPAPTAPSAAAPAPANHHRHGGIVGQISAINPSTWTVTTAKGVAYTVDITPTTAFGTKAAPSTASQFTMGEKVRVMGQRQDNTVTATRIVQARNRGLVPAAPADSAPANPPAPGGQN